MTTPVFTERVEHDRWLFASGLLLFNEGDFYASHERWEDLWLRNRTTLRPLLQGLIQLAGAYHHLERGNLVGATALLRAVRERLVPYAPRAFGIEVAPVLDHLELASEPGSIASFAHSVPPRIVYVLPSLDEFRPHAGSASGPSRKRNWHWARAGR